MMLTASFFYPQFVKMHLRFKINHLTVNLISTTDPFLPFIKVVICWEWNKFFLPQVPCSPGLDNNSSNLLKMEAREKQGERDIALGKQYTIYLGYMRASTSCLFLCLRREGRSDFPACRPIIPKDGSLQLQMHAFFTVNSLSAILDKPDKKRKQAVRVAIHKTNSNLLFFFFW